MKFRLHCTECKSEAYLIHEMDSHHFDIDHCPFCGADMDEDTIEEVEEYDD